jgi:hypothetical protein
LPRPFAGTALAEVCLFGTGQKQFPKYLLSNMQDLNKEWLVEAQGVVYEADLEELKQWISESAVLPSDRVRRGSLRWLPAKNVPELQEIIKEALEVRVEVPTITDELAALMNPNQDSEPEEREPEVLTAEQSVNASVDWCHFHDDRSIAFVCDVCEHSFCKTCPKSFGGGVKLCPLCDALCRAVTESVSKYRSVGALHKPYSEADEAAENAKNKKKYSPERLISFVRHKLSSSRV